MDPKQIVELLGRRLGISDLRASTTLGALAKRLGKKRVFKAIAEVERELESEFPDDLMDATTVGELADCALEFIEYELND